MSCSRESRKLCANNECKICFEKSFASHPKAANWIQGGITPREVSMFSNQKFWFRCDICHHEFEKELGSLTNGGCWCPFCATKKVCDNQSCQFCFNSSFASHFRSAFWSPLNKVTPRECLKKSKKQYWFKCDKCPHEFKAGLGNIVNGDTWCPYCSHQKLCDADCDICFENSFASHPYTTFWSDKNTKQPRQCFKGSNIKSWFDCNECGHTFDKKLNKITGGDQWCPYCSGKKLCIDEFCAMCWDASLESYPCSSHWDFDKNYPTVPRDVFKGSAKKYWFICENGHSFDITPNAITTNNGWCSICVWKTQKKLFEWLREQYPNYTTVAEKTFNWCIWEPTGKKCRYDFYIPELDLLIELDGDQHFVEVSNWKCLESTQEKDIFKMKKALENGKSMIRIKQMDVYHNRNDWQNKLRESIQKYESPQIIYIGDTYDCHRKLMS